MIGLDLLNVRIVPGGKPLDGSICPVAFNAAFAGRIYSVLGTGISSCSTILSLFSYYPLHLFSYYPHNAKNISNKLKYFSISILNLL